MLVIEKYTKFVQSNRKILVQRDLLNTNNLIPKKKKQEEKKEMNMNGILVHRENH